MKQATSRRSDAIRNDERILDGSMRELGRNPLAGMDEIAAACGVSRATLFRRHPSRDRLISDLRDHAHEDLRAAVDGARLGEGTPAEALGRLTEALVAIGVPYSFLLQNPLEPGSQEGTRYIAKPVAALIRRGQRDGVFDSSAPPDWWVEVIVAVLQVAARNAGASGRGSEAAELMRLTLTRGLAA
jgi:TetR/AcrR family transcriptional regulator, mexCD-oprJ operon repressor